MKDELEDFWRWWGATRDDVVAAIGADAAESPALMELLDRASELGLECEVGEGIRARYAVCFSPAGDPGLRKLAHRWRAGAPADDPDVEFHPHRIASPDASSWSMSMDGVRFAFDELRFAITRDEERDELDLEVQHPAFPELTEEQRRAFGFQALDALLGEEEVERWIGELAWSAAPPTATDGPEELVAAVARLRAVTPTDEWAILRGVDAAGNEAVAVAARPLRPVDHPFYDEVVELCATVEGDEVGVLQEREHELQRAFAGVAFHAASRTAGGERVAWVFCDGDTSVPGKLDAWATARGYAVERRRDPAWDAVRALR